MFKLGGNHSIGKIKKRSHLVNRPHGIIHFTVQGKLKRGRKIRKSNYQIRKKQTKNRQSMPRKPPTNGVKFKPGESGNPKGRPKKIPALDKLLADVLGSIDDQDSEMKAVINALIVRAKKGDVRAAEVLLDRAYGKPKQDINLSETIEQVFVIGGKTIKF